MSANALCLRIPAKVNLSLDCTGKRPDGYHTLRSVFQAVSIYDTLVLQQTVDHAPLRMTCNQADLPCDGRNLVVRAVQTLLGTEANGLRLHLQKQIPSQAGMGGGSADAAAALLGVCALYDLSISAERLRAIAATLGADVPFFLMGGTALAEGIGEQLTPLSPPPMRLLVVAKGRQGVSTPAAYAELDALASPLQPATDAVLRQLYAPDADALFAACGNAFDAVTDLPEVQTIRCVMRTHAVQPVLSGSGAAVFGGCASMEQAIACQLALQEAGLPFVTLCQTVAHGILRQTTTGWANL